MRFTSRAIATLALIAAAACGAASGPQTAAPGASPRDGVLTGLVRDAVTGDPIADAVLTILRGESEAGGHAPSQAAALHSDASGGYRVALAAGNYHILAVAGERRLELDHVVLGAGRTLTVDILMNPAALAVEVVDVRYAGQQPPRRFRRARPSSRGVIEGTVTDLGSNERVAGAVVIATSPLASGVLHTIADDSGRFELDELRPGSYTLSIYYRVVDRGNIEIRRSDIEVAAAETTFVELLLDSRGPP